MRGPYKLNIYFSKLSSYLKIDVVVRYVKIGHNLEKRLLYTY